ncbi:MAG: hypothetical protein JNN30_09820 [Rhodanobacteraceae bacterium]|nr:hypothetical protein [Rhodanobacteraceae bacterium]
MRPLHPLRVDATDGVVPAFTADVLGDAQFRSDHGLRYAYLAGAMYKGISSSEFVIALGRAGMPGYPGTAGRHRARLAGCRAHHRDGSRTELRHPDGGGDLRRVGLRPTYRPGRRVRAAAGDVCAARPARANKLYELYQRFGSIEEVDERTRQQIQEKYFRRSFDDVWNETRSYCPRAAPQSLQEIERSPEPKMALIFKWNFVHTTRLAMQGVPNQQVDYQIHCGPALGAFKQWMKNTPLESWRNRYDADLGKRLMEGAAEFLNQRFAALLGAGRAGAGGTGADPSHAADAAAIARRP